MKKGRNTSRCCLFCGTSLFMYEKTVYWEACVCPGCYQALEAARTASMRWFSLATRLSEHGYSISLLTGEIEEIDA